MNYSRRVTNEARRARISDEPSQPLIGARAARGLVSAQPRQPTAAAPQAGRVQLRIGTKRDGSLYVPTGVSAERAAPLVVFFHGAGGNAGQADMIVAHAERHGLLVLAIDSRGPTWDVIHSQIGPDVVFLDAALRWTFDRFTVDRDRIAVAGFSDGASYALTIGLANGELVSHVLAFSPGFEAPPEVHGRPRLFISHGVRDTVLPVDVCSRKIVPRLERLGYSVTYREFDGPHSVPMPIVSAALEWMLEAAPSG